VEIPPPLGSSHEAEKPPASSSVTVNTISFIARQSRRQAAPPQAGTGELIGIASNCLQPLQSIPPCPACPLTFRDIRKIELIELQAGFREGVLTARILNPGSRIRTLTVRFQIARESPRMKWEENRRRNFFTRLRHPCRQTIQRKGQQCRLASTSRCSYQPDHREILETKKPHSYNGSSLHPPC